jgi:hypothetical protein
MNTEKNPAPALDAAERMEASLAGKVLRRRRRLSAHAVRTAKAALDALDGTRHIDRRRREFQFIARFEGELVTALGGADVVSPQQAAICRMAARTALLLEQVDTYIQDPEGLGHPIHRGKRALFPLVVQRQSLAAALLSQLQAIGLERRAKPLQDLRTYLASKVAPAPSAASAASPAVVEHDSGGTDQEEARDR